MLRSPQSYVFTGALPPSSSVPSPSLSSVASEAEERDEEVKESSNTSPASTYPPSPTFSDPTSPERDVMSPFQLHFDYAYHDSRDLLELSEEEDKPRKDNTKRKKDFVIDNNDGRLVDLDKAFKRERNSMGVKVAWLRSDAIRADLVAANPLLPELTKAHVKLPLMAQTLKELKEKPKIVKTAGKVSNFAGLPPYLLEVLHDVQYFNVHDASYAGEAARQTYHKDIRGSVGQFLRWLFMTNAITVDDLGTPFQILATITADRHDEYIQYRQGLGYKNLFTSGYQLANFMKYVSLAVASKYEHSLHLCTTFTINTILFTFPFMFLIRFPAETNENVVKRLKAAFGANKTLEEISSQIQKQGQRISLNSNAMKKVQVPCFRFPLYVHLPSCQSL